MIELNGRKRRKPYEPSMVTEFLDPGRVGVVSWPSAELVAVSSFLDLFAGGGLSSPLRTGVLEDGRKILFSGVLLVWVLCWGGG